MCLQLGLTYKEAMLLDIKTVLEIVDARKELRSSGDGRQKDD